MKIAVDRQIDTKAPGLAIAAVDADGVLWSEGFGHANLATGLGMTPGTTCNWFSMTKLVTATAVMQSADERRRILELHAHLPRPQHWRRRHGQCHLV